jgi:hypothetical protein
MQPMYTPYTTPARSAIPRAIGIMAIVFAVLGFAASVLFTWGPLEDIGRGGAARLGKHSGMVITWIYVWGAISLVLFLVHLIGGVYAIAYKPIGLKLLTAYAVGALVLVAIDLVVMLGFVSGRRSIESVQFPRLLFAVFATPWPIIVLALVNNRRAKASCT